MNKRSDMVSKVLTQAVLTRQLLPGTKLGEAALADLFGFSRTVIQQSLIRLSEDGLVTLERNKGAYVSRPSQREAIEIYDALTIIEQGVAALLSGRLDRAGWGKLRHHVERQARAVEHGNDELADQLGEDFHVLLVHMARNQVVQDMHAHLMRRTALLRSLVRSRFDYCGLVKDHDDLIDLLEAGELQEAQKLIDLHNRNVVRGFLMDEQAEPGRSAREALEPLLRSMADSPAGLRSG